MDEKKKRKKEERLRLRLRKFAKFGKEEDWRWHRAGQHRFFYD